MAYLVRVTKMDAQSERVSRAGLQIFSGGRMSRPKRGYEATREAAMAAFAKSWRR